MAPPSKKGPDGPDGAKPGAQVPPTASDRHAFDADARAATREAAPITIGEIVFHRRRKNWAITRELRAQLRIQERAGVRSRRATKRIEDMDADADMSAIEALETEQDLLADESDEAAYGIVALLLRDENGKSPEIDHLKEWLDVEEAGDLAATLSTGGEPDPTPTTQSSSNS
jgi:hypothetical protein